MNEIDDINNEIKGEQADDGFKEKDNISPEILVNNFISDKVSEKQS